MGYVPTGGSGGASIGGTVTGATAGSVFFAGAAGVMAQDNAGFFYDDANNQLKLTASAATQTPLQINLASSQSANALEIKDSSGNLEFSVAADASTYGIGFGAAGDGNAVRALPNFGIQLVSNFNSVVQGSLNGQSYIQTAYGQRLMGGNINLTNSSATTVGSITVPTLGTSSGVLHVSIVAKDATDVQTRTQIVRWEAVNKGGVYTTNVTVVSEGAAVSTGTLTATWSITTGSDTINIRITPVSSLTPTTFTLRYAVDSMPNGTWN